MASPTSKTRLAACLCALALAPQAVGADGWRLDSRLHAQQQVAIGLADADAGQARLTIRSESRARVGRHWSGRLGVRAEVAADDTGLGTIDTYRAASKPAAVGNHARLELDEFALTWRGGATRVTLGKQTFAWGVLDGLQVTDRMDAVRRRDSVFTARRPERIGRWAARLESTAAGVRWDVAAVLDSSGDQLARIGDTYEVTAPRLRAGLPPTAATPPLDIDTAGSATFGLRAHRRFGAHDAALIVIHGPDTEPVITSGTGGIVLTYPGRRLYGANWQVSAGATVWRAELAIIPDQAVNVTGPQPSIRTRRRVLAGVGVDWDLPGGLFANAQLGIDRIDGDRLVRPALDQIVTLRLQRTFANETWRWSTEFIGSLTDGDGTLRPALRHQVNDALSIDTGIDIVWGDRTGLFGQFHDTDRVWLRVALAF